MDVFKPTLAGVYALITLGCVGWAPVWSLRFACTAVALLVVWRQRRILRSLCAALLVVTGHVIDARYTVSFFAHVGTALGLATAYAGVKDERDVSERDTTIRLVLTTLLLVIFVSSPLGFYAERAIARGLPGKGNVLGASLGGARVGLVVLVLLLVNAGRTRLGIIRTCVCAVGAVVVLHVITPLLLQLASPFGSGPEGRDRLWIAALVPWVQIPVGTVALAVGHGWKHSVSSSSTGSSSTRAGVAIALVLALVATVSGTQEAPTTPKSWRLYERGYLSWGKPSSDITGEYSLGMLGTLPEFISDLGIQCELDDDLTTLTPLETQGLMITNLDHRIDGQSLKAVDEFVAGGGTLLVVGDHTFVEKDAPSARDAGIRLNDVLTRSHIRFENDSADPLVPGWYDSTVETGRMTLMPSEKNPSGCLVGGALSIEWPAQPLVIGKFGYRDIGVNVRQGDTRGWLGDLIWNPEEAIGDVVLAATEKIGKGRIIVVGDTTGVFNGSRPFRWAWWERLFAGKYELWQRPGDLSVGLLVVAGAALVLLVPLRPRTKAQMLGFAVLVIGGLLLLLQRPTVNAPSADSCVVDTSVMFPGRYGSWKGDGRLAIVSSSHRAGLSPRFAKAELDAVRARAKTIAILAPQVYPGNAWTEKLILWVESGGHLVVATSWADSKNIAPLLERAGVEVTGTVLGPGPCHWHDDSNGADGTYLLEPWALRLRNSEWRPLLWRRGAVIGASRTWGAGTMSIVGDSRFLGNSELEGEWGANRANLRLAESVLVGHGAE